MAVIGALLAPSVGLRVDPYDCPRNVSPAPADALNASVAMGIGLRGLAHAVSGGVRTYAQA